jgi:hypothetical protein
MAGQAVDQAYTSAYKLEGRELLTIDRHAMSTSGCGVVKFVNPIEQ